MLIELRGRTVALVIQRNRRRRSRVGISFDPTGEVRIDAPPRTSLAEIEEIVRGHERWIVRNIDKARRADGVLASSLAPGDLVSLAGEQKLLQVEPLPANTPCVTVTQARITLSLRDPASEAERIAALSSLWRAVAADRFRLLLAEYGERLPWLNAGLPNWRQRFMRSQWGSCSADGRVSLNSHLGKLPDELVRYVVLHELCHLVHLNHSRRYYALLDTYMPGWSRHRAGLDRWAMVLLEPYEAASTPVRIEFESEKTSLTR